MFLKKNRKDVWNANLTQGAKLVGKYDFAPIPKATQIPDDIVGFDKEKDKPTAWVRFFMHDYKFVHILASPEMYFEKLKSHKGIISPDFSVYYDMPLHEQISSVAKNRAVGYYFAKNGMNVIPSVNWGDKNTYDFCFDGIAKGSVVAVGTHGCVKKLQDRAYFERGFIAMLNRIEPPTVVIYGSDSDRIIYPIIKSYVKIVSFKSDFEIGHKKEAI
jgi:hypothetical protein